MSSVPAESRVIQLPLFRVGAAALGRPAAGETPAATLDVHAISIPSRAFTGDFYFVHRGTDRLWFALGDVAGKGINAAVVMAMIQEELEHRIQSCAATACDPSVTMMRLHAFLKPLIPANRFATVVIGSLSDDGTLRIANAGHCSPLIVRAGGKIEHVESTGPVVGVLSASQWCTFQTTLARGETLVLYSDGVLEARSQNGEEFGIERIEENTGRTSARHIAENILNAVIRHSGSAREDDLTLVVVRR